MGNQQYEHNNNNNIRDRPYQVLWQEQNGQIVRETGSGNILFIRQISISNQEHYNHVLSQLKTYISEQNCEQVVKLVRIQPKLQEKVCGSIYKIGLYFAYSHISILEEVSVRAQTLKYFDKQDIYSIVRGCLQGLNSIQKTINKHNTISHHEIVLFNRVFVNPNRIVVMENGMIQILNPLMVTQVDRFTRKHKSYYSPEKLSDFSFEDDQKSALFELGITLLHIITLKDCRNMYNGFEVKQDEINYRIEEVYSLYGSQQLCRLLTSMTQTLRSKRVSVQECVSMMNQLLTQGNTQPHYNNYTQNIIPNIETVKSMTTTSRKNNTNTKEQNAQNTQKNVMAQIQNNKQNRNSYNIMENKSNTNNFLAAFRSSVQDSECSIQSYRYGNQMDKGILHSYKSINRIRQKAKLTTSIINNINTCV